MWSHIIFKTSYQYSLLLLPYQLASYVYRNSSFFFNCIDISVYYTYNTLEGGVHMISFQGLTLHKKESVYLQIISYVKQLMLSGKVENYEEMPSRRVVALTLSINPNTVQKAYKILEEEGIIKTIGNVKSVVIMSEDNLNHIKQEFMEETVSRFVSDCKSGGMNFQEIVALLAKKWDA